MGKRGEELRKVVRAALAQSFEQLVTYEPAVLEGRDPEAVHRMRVATRRLRSDLGTFEPVLDPTWATSLRADLRWLTGDLGAVRDIDVLHERLARDCTQLPDAEAEAAARALRRLDADLAAALATLSAALRSSAYTALRDDLADAAKQPLLRRSRGKSRAALEHALRRRWKKLERAQRKLGARPSDGALHNVRIRAKKCRYAAEACVPVFGKDAERLARACARIQDVLGEQHDAVVAGAWLAKTAAECTPEEAFALGRLAELERIAAARAKGQFGSAWKKARRAARGRWR